HGEQALVEVDDAVDGHPVDLDVLARRDVCDPAPIAVRHVGEAVELVGGEHAARDLDALHVARGVELVVEAVGEADRAPLVARELATDEAVGPALVARQGAQVLLSGGAHRSGIAAQSKHYDGPPASKSTWETRGRLVSGPGPCCGLPLRSEWAVAKAPEGGALLRQRRERRLRALVGPAAGEPRHELAEHEPSRTRLARRLHGRVEALHAPGVVRERAVTFGVRRDRQDDVGILRGPAP